MVTDKRGISALLLQRQLGLSRYETAWMLLHKLRRAMVNATREPMHGEVEIDDTWIGGPQPGLRGSLRIPEQVIQGFRSKAPTDSDRSHPAIPRESIQGFRPEAIQFWGAGRNGG